MEGKDRLVGNTAEDVNLRREFSRSVPRGLHFGAIGEIVESNNDRFGVGGFVQGMWGWQDYALSDGSDVNPIDPDPMKTSGRM